MPGTTGCRDDERRSLFPTASSPAFATPQVFRRTRPLSGKFAPIRLSDFAPLDVADRRRDRTVRAPLAEPNAYPSERHFMDCPIRVFAQIRRSLNPLP